MGGVSLISPWLHAKTDSSLKIMHDSCSRSDRVLFFHFKCTTDSLVVAADFKATEINAERKTIEIGFRDSWKDHPSGEYLMDVVRSHQVASDPILSDAREDDGIEQEGEDGRSCSYGTSPAP